MIIVYVPPADSRRNSTIDVQLEHANMVFDPKIMGGLRCRGYKFNFSVKGRTLTITRIDRDEGWHIGFRLRAYLPTEDIPDFTSTVYTYYGLDNEEAPKDVTEAFIHPSATTIQRRAFYECRSLVRVTIPDTATHIEDEAFCDCNSLRFILLSTNLEFIGRRAFYYCKLLEAVFLPPTINRIDNDAFHGCRSLRICILPETIDRVGNDVFVGCKTLPTAVRNNLSKVCYSTSVNSQTIQECIHTHGIEHATEVDYQNMMALHILCANPHVTADCIRTYLEFAPEAAEQQDFDRITPFQRLCRNDFFFLEDRSFSSVMAWWYHCMP